MSLDVLLGNAQLKNDLALSLSTGHISHRYLITGPRGSGKRTLAGLLAAALLCEGSEKPCGICRSCRKALARQHPDFITVDDPEKKTVPVELIRQTREDVFVRPNEGTRKVYLFPRAQDMGLPGQNALLKVLEEPPEYAVFLLLADSPEKLLPTVRSRCRELRLTALPQPLLISRLTGDYPNASPEDIRRAAIRGGCYLGQAKELLEEGMNLSPQTLAFVRAFSHADALQLCTLLAPMEKWKRDALIGELSNWLRLLEEALTGADTMSSAAAELSRAQGAPRLLAAVQSLQKAVAYAQGNVSPGAICGWLSWELR